MSILSVKNLTFGYEDCPVFNDFSINFEEGNLYCIVGENGAGKTTLLKCITSLINNGTSIYYNECEIAKNKNLLKNFSYIMNEDTLYDYMTVLENISFYKNLFSENCDFVSRVKEILVALNCYNYKDYLVKNLSQGTRNKIYLAIMLCKKAKIILLDEPFTALDNKSQKFFFEFIKNKSLNDNITVLMVTHIDEFKSIANKTIHIEKSVLCDKNND